MCSVNNYLYFFFSSSILFSFVFLYDRCIFFVLYTPGSLFFGFLGINDLIFMSFFLMHRGPICFNTYFTSEYEQFLFLLFFILSSPLYPLVIAVYFILKQVLFPLTEFVSTLPYINSPVSGTFLSCSFIL